MVRARPDRRHNVEPVAPGGQFVSDINNLEKIEKNDMTPLSGVNPFLLYIYDDDTPQPRHAPHDPSGLRL
jgi:hypothetical protein